jgi:two-component system, NarL family, sensor histidine kinase UhpB
MGDRPGDPPSRTLAAAPRTNRTVESIVARRVSTTDWATSDHLRTFVDNSTTCIYVKDAAGRYLLINRQFERIFHVQRADFVGRADFDVFPPDIAHALRQNDIEVMQRDEPVEFEEVVPQDDGPHTYISIKFPLRDGDGNVEGVCGISTDITERQKAEAQLRRLAQQLVSVREEERQRLSFRIHDEICQELTGITFMIAAASRRLAPELAAAVPELDRAGTQLAHVIDHLRSVARGLHPVVLRELGLAESLRTLAQTLSTPRLSIDVAVPEALPTLSAEQALGVYRIAQEAVLNAVRHADTHSVRVVVRTEPNRVRLIVADDGRGFDTRAVASKSLGLLGMEQRAIAVGGTLEIDSAPGRGTRVSFVCPLAGSEPEAT